MGVLTHAQWNGVVAFAKAVAAEIITSFAIGAGTRDATGAWTPEEARKFVEFAGLPGGVSHQPIS
jgi:heparanase 1